MMGLGFTDLSGKVKIDERVYYRARAALRSIARKGCQRLVDPSTCRQPNGYPREEWCDPCIAADGLGLPVDWFVLR